MNERVERVRARLEAPLLVTKPVNVGWLTGLDSSNAALLVEPDRLRIFTDSGTSRRPAPLGIEVVEIPRGLFASCRSRCQGGWRSTPRAS